MNECWLCLTVTGSQEVQKVGTIESAPQWSAGKSDFILSYLRNGDDDEVKWPDLHVRYYKIHVRLTQRLNTSMYALVHAAIACSHLHLPKRNATLIKRHPP